MPTSEHRGGLLLSLWQLSPKEGPVPLGKLEGGFGGRACVACRLWVAGGSCKPAGAEPGSTGSGAIRLLLPACHT